MNILIVDDDPFLQKSLSFQLLEAGHTVSLASDGKAAIDLIEKNRNVEVLVVDVNMPVLTGPSLILTLKKYFPAKLPLIIIVSGMKEGEEFLKKIDVKHDHYFNKPLDYKAFLNLIGELEKHSKS